MITAKNIYNSKVYKQLKASANGDKQKLKWLVERYVKNYNSYWGNCSKFSNETTLSTSFIWERTPQGHRYWAGIHDETHDKVCLWHSL